MLRVRPVSPAEVLPWMVQLKDAYGPDLTESQIARAWEALHLVDGYYSRVLESVDPMGDVQIRALSAFALTSASYGRELASSTEPFLAGHVLRRWMREGKEPLHGDALRAAQQGEGCAVVTIHSVYPHEPPGEFGSPEEGEALYHSSIRILRGLNWQLSVREVFTPRSLMGYRGGGWRVHNAYGSADGVPTLDNPVLMVFDAKDAEENPGARMTAHFVEYPTHMHLRPAHKELLLAALDGMTDEELAESLSLALPSVKSRWKTLYSHLAEVSPGLYRALGGETLGSVRSAERRLHLLAYLREHPEELAPWAS